MVWRAITHIIRINLSDEIIIPEYVMCNPAVCIGKVSASSVFGLIKELTPWFDQILQ